MSCSMNSITLSDVTLEDLLPHRDNMMLVQEVLEVDSQCARTRFVVKKSWPMADDKGVHPLILIELAAQTAGVCNGWDRIQTKGVESDQMGGQDTDQGGGVRPDGLVGGGKKG